VGHILAKARREQKGQSGKNSLVVVLDGFLDGQGLRAKFVSLLLAIPHPPHQIPLRVVHRRLKNVRGFRANYSE
jgi:hypothetical protein